MRGGARRRSGSTHPTQSHPPFFEDRMKLTRRALTAVAVVVTFAALGCGSDSSTGPDVPSPILGVQALTRGATSITINFNGNAGDNSYDIERAEGAAGTFANIASV